MTVAPASWRMPSPSTSRSPECCGHGRRHGHLAATAASGWWAGGRQGHAAICAAVLPRSLARGPKGTLKAGPRAEAR